MLLPSVARLVVKKPGKFISWKCKQLLCISHLLFLLLLLLFFFADEERTTFCRLNEHHGNFFWNELRRITTLSENFTERNGSALYKFSCSKSKFFFLLLFFRIQNFLGRNFCTFIDRMDL